MENYDSDQYNNSDSCDEGEDLVIGREATKGTRKRKKRKKKHYFLRFLLLVAVAVGLYYFLSSSFFDIQTIKVGETSHFTKQEIVKLSGVKKGCNLFKADLGASTDALLKEPYIKEVRIKRSIPSTVYIAIKERQEAVAVPYGDIYILMDKEGMVLRKVDVAPELPILIGMTIRNMDPGKRIEVEESGVLERTFAMLEAMEESDIYFKKIDISQVTVKAYINDLLICKGSPADILTNMKNGNLKTVLYDLYTKGTERGIINISGENYCSFSPNIQ